MVDYKLGQIVKSTAGRDTGQFFIIIQMDEQYIYLVDGDSRRLETPKKKKKKHVQITHAVALNIADRINNDDKLSNADIRRSLKDFINED